MAKSLNRRLLITLGIPTIFIPGLILASVLGWDWQNDLQKIQKSGYKDSNLIFQKQMLVTTVIDGDTFEIANGQTVRLIGLNAPDRGEAGYEQASAYLKGLIEGEEVELEYDSYHDDQYGRLLAYVWEKCETQLGCKNGKRMINWVLVKEGYGEFVSYKGRAPLTYEDLLKKTQN
ncbi:hypothetical protein GW777_07190 [Candidatus Peregrinibacteria bacterium]|uniref:TNase-like domain-containing protein n=1 Tax=Candidatus Roizmanbacteria bacterium CG22_combo_CG10-13_8_21_14_all_38_20 TaxID=1974862 RepID=A0A2H0BVH3_9BACT|nr:hypothetical protein [Candidatus Peregrinibacteria bacterium]PIP61683.1 MAG: hypothetical protein COW99_02840 [Candidatus Roizmanbacteria bacterium CG22_combo_CG10-13_8_21_14_all_38_20]PJC31389.1 MAG: hypothetical protein CO050_03385 [Candidatus Roizmanbacteria bacterium CG_4_9_14_0_2_um_filter_38_17]